MPKFIVPHKSPSHRVAAIALYRALLTQTKAALSQLNNGPSNEAQNLIRNRFREQRYVTSHRQLQLSFAAGYEALDHLDAAVAGYAERRHYLLDLIRRAPEKAKLEPSSPARAEPANVRDRKAAEFERERERRRVQRKEIAAAKAKGEVLDLFSRPVPLEKLSGKRRVPVLFSAMQIPVLRIKKPQPPALTAYLVSRIAQRQRRHDRRHFLEEAVKLAREEDRWDMIVGKNANVGVGEDGGVRWYQEVDRQVKEVWAALENEKAKNRDMARKMQAVVDRETELYERERAEERVKRKLEKKGGDREKDGVELVKDHGG